MGPVDLLLLLHEPLMPVLVRVPILEGNVFAGNLDETRA
jgi:hypothetical protein